MAIKDNTGKEMTIEEILEKTVDLLEWITVPVAMTKISDQIRGAVQNLQIVLQVMEAEKAAAEKAAAEKAAAEKTAAESAEADGEPKLEVLPGGPEGAPKGGMFPGGQEIAAEPGEPEEAAEETGAEAGE